MFDDSWRKELERRYEDIYVRLCECRNTIEDIVIMANLMYKYNTDKTEAECLDRMIEWVCDWNNQDYIADKITPKKYNKMLGLIKDINKIMIY